MGNERLGYSYAAIGLGSFSLLLALVHVFAGPFAPSPSIGTTLGEIAGEIRAAAVRAAAGTPQPAPVAGGWNIDRVIAVLVPTLALLGIVTGLVGLIRDEPRKAALGGIALGIGAILAQFFFWLVMVICGMVLIATILKNFEAILD